MIFRSHNVHCSSRFIWKKACIFAYECPTLLWMTYIHLQWTWLIPRFILPYINAQSTNKKILERDFFRELGLKNVLITFYKLLWHHICNSKVFSFKSTFKTMNETNSHAALRQKNVRQVVRFRGFLWDECWFFILLELHSSRRFELIFYWTSGSDKVFSNSQGTHCFHLLYYCVKNCRLFFQNLPRPQEVAIISRLSRFVSNTWGSAKHNLLLCDG